MKIREAKEQERKENKSQMIQIIILWTWQCKTYSDKITIMDMTFHGSSSWKWTSKWFKISINYKEDLILGFIYDIYIEFI
jgi:hypothetical protein